jgi:hypothetical protein
MNLLLAQNLGKSFFPKTLNIAFRKNQNAMLKVLGKALFPSFGSKTCSFAVFMDRTANGHVFLSKILEKVFCPRFRTLHFCLLHFAKAKRKLKWKLLFPHLKFFSN